MGCESCYVLESREPGLRSACPLTWAPLVIQLRGPRKDSPPAERRPHISLFSLLPPPPARCPAAQPVDMVLTDLGKGLRRGGACLDPQVEALAQQEDPGPAPRRPCSHLTDPDYLLGPGLDPPGSQGLCPASLRNTCFLLSPARQAPVGVHAAPRGKGFMAVSSTVSARTPKTWLLPCPEPQDGAQA